MPGAEPSLRAAFESLECADRVRLLARAARDAGGDAVVVGGWARDALLGVDSSDVDIELHGFAPAEAARLLAAHGALRGGGQGGRGELAQAVGRVHPVWLLGRPPLQVSLAPLADRGSEEPLATRHASAARRRDLTINSLGWDPLAAQLFDPCGGRADLLSRTLRACDPHHFVDDPLRAFRVARFVAQLDGEGLAAWTVEPELVRLCRGLEVSAVATERIFAELGRLLATPRPSLGLETLRDIGALRALPEVAELIDTPQDEQWHPEGCVWTHTKMVVDEAAAQRGDRAGTEHGRWLLLGALCHDLGKPSTTSIDGDGRVRSPSHDVRGEEITVEFLSRLRASDRTVRAVAALVRWHLAPLLLSKQGAGDRAYRKLARRLDAAGIDGALLVDLARADHWGRTTPEALARDFSDAEAFVERLRALDLMESAPVDRVRGRDVLARGIAPGPEVGRIVTRCREIQDESGWTDPDQILDRALAES